MAVAGFFFDGFAAGLALGFAGLDGFFVPGCLWAPLAGASFALAVLASGFAASLFAGLFGFVSAAGFSAGGALTVAGAAPAGGAAAIVADLGLRPRFLGTAPSVAGASFFAARPRRTGAGGGGGSGGL